MVCIRYEMIKRVFATDDDVNYNSYLQLHMQNDKL